MLYVQAFTHTLSEPIIEKGEVYEGKLNINLSSIYTRLIQEAGRLCDRYASDLFIEYDSIQMALDDRVTETHIIGFRESGVDHTKWVCNKTPNELKSEYRSIWRLDIEFLPDDYWEYVVKVTLQRVEYSTAEHNWHEHFGKYDKYGNLKEENKNA